MTWWPGIIWLLGAAIFGVRAAFVRFLLLVFRARHRATADAALEERVGELATRLEIRRTVRLMEFPRVSAPVAFGVFWPTIGLPPGFTTSFSTSQQDAVLAHELAHLASCDPLWNALTDFVAAALWWQPLVWLSRRQLQAANEHAADEASVVVADGPKVLAECLVELGGRLTNKQSLGWLNMAGFRSHLGNRVERLVNLHDRAWSPPGRVCTWIAKTAGLVALAATGIFSTAWVAPQPFPNQPQTKGEQSMKRMKQYWLNSVANVALVAALGIDNGLYAQNQPEQPAPAGKTDATTPKGAEGGDPEAAQGSGAPQPHQNQGTRTPTFNPYLNMSKELRQRYRLDRVAANEPMMNTEMARRYGLTAASQNNATKPRAIEAKLESISLSEVQFDALPLSEVLKFLFEESKKRDPDKEGINFLLTHNTDVPMQTVDPNTGLPIAPPAIDVNGAMVRFNLPLRNVRLIDVLNAIVKVADQPVKFSVEEFGVVFSPDTQSPRMAYLSQPIVAEPEQLRIRTFKVDPKAFLQGLEGTFGISSPSTEKFNRLANSLRKIELQLKDVEEAERQVAKNYENKTATREDLDKAQAKVEEVEHHLTSIKQEMLSESAKQSASVQETLRKVFGKLGVNMDAPKAVFYNPVTGIVMVKVSARDLEVVQAALETLGGSPTSAQQAAGFRATDGTTGGLAGVLGGTDKAPVIGDLPLLGRLFRSEKGSSDDPREKLRR